MDKILDKKIINNKIPNNWNYEKSVTKLIPVVQEYKEIIIEANKLKSRIKSFVEDNPDFLHELYVANIMLDGRDGRNLPTTKSAISESGTFSNYCKAIRLPKRTAYRWLHRYHPELFAKELTAEISESINIINGDCLDELEKIGNDTIDLIIIDPPQFGIVSDKWDNNFDNYNNYLDWCKKWISESLRVLKNTGSIYIWCTIGEKSDMAIRIKLIGDEIGLYYKDWVTWKKKRGLGNKRGWLYTREEILWFVKNNDNYFWNEDNQYNEKEINEFDEGFSGYDCKSKFKRITNVWVDIPEIIGNKDIDHSTPKPIEAIERIIKAHTVEGQIVLDFFGGSGSTALACKNLKRNCILIEKEKSYLNIIKRQLS